MKNNQYNIKYLSLFLAFMSLATDLKSQSKERDMLTNQIWKLKKWTYKDTNGKVENLLESLSNCEKDNTTVYKANGNFFQMDEGIKCGSSNNKIIGEGSWKFTKEGTLIESFLGGKPTEKHIVKISDTYLVLQQQEHDGAIQEWVYRPPSLDIEEEIEEIKFEKKEDLAEVSIQEENKPESPKTMSIDDQIKQYEDSIKNLNRPKKNTFYDDREYINLGINTGYFVPPNYSDFEGDFPVLIYYENSGKLWDYDLDIPSYVWQGGYLRYRRFKPKNVNENAPKIFGLGLKGGINLASLTNVAMKKKIFPNDLEIFFGFILGYDINLNDESTIEESYSEAKAGLCLGVRYHILENIGVHLELGNTNLALINTGINFRIYEN